MKNRRILTAVVTSVIFWMAVPVPADEAAAIAALREAGFKVQQTTGDGGSRAPNAGLRREAGFKAKSAAVATELGFGQPEWTPKLWQRLGEITSLTTLRGTAKCADNGGLEVLAKLPRLETLYLNAGTFDDEGFAILAKVKSLQSLALDHNQRITGSGVSALKSLPNLRSLRFGGCMKFTGEGVKASAELVQLESLQLHHCGVGDDDLPPLATMPNLKSLFVSFQFNARFTGAGLKHLAQIQTLESLKMAETVVAYDGGLDALTRLKRLKKLELEKIGVLAADIEKLRAALPQTEITWTAASDEDIAQFHRRAAGAKKLPN